MENKTTILTERFFTGLFPSILYDDADDYVLTRFIVEQADLVHGLVTAYFGRMETESTCEVSDFYVDGTLVDGIVILRVQLREKCATTIKRAYLVFQMDENEKARNKRYYVTVSGAKGQAYCRCIEKNGFYKELGQTFDLDEEANLILKEFRISNILIFDVLEACDHHRLVHIN